MPTLTSKIAAMRSPARYRHAGVNSGAIRIYRKLWTARTVVTRTPDELISALPSEAVMSKSNLAIFTMSRNLPRETLSLLVKRFQDLPVPAIGCLSQGSDGNSGPYCLSYAFHQSPNNKLEMIVPFRSSIQGTPKISVGREVARMEKRLETMEWAGDDSVVPDQLPEELRSVDPRFIENIFYFTDDQPQGLMRTMDVHLPKATKIGLVAAPTPFATGRGHTLLSGKDIFSDGAVGIAICRYPKKFNHVDDLNINYGDLEPLGDALEVTACKGNIVLEVASANATRTLLERIQSNVASAITKDLGFYLGILPDNTSKASLDQMSSVRPIIAGDPSRGALSLDTEANVRVGQKVQFFHTPRRHEKAISYLPASNGRDRLPDSSRPVLVFRSDLDPDALQHVDPASSTLNHFVGASEQGFIVGRPHQSSWICQVDGSQGDVLL